MPVSGASYNQWSQPQSPTQGLAIVSLVLGIFGFFTLGGLIVGAITGSIIGWIAMMRAKHEPWRYGGKGIAIAGFVLNIAMLVWVPLVAAIAVPNLMASRRAANEASAIHTLRQLSDAQSEYQSNFGKYGTLDELVAQDLIDQKLATGRKNGYKFRIEITTDENNLQGFVVTAVPLTSTSGTRSFYVDETLVVRAADKSGEPASKLDPPLGAEREYPSTRSDRRADYRPQTVY
jgi:type II secretory pathway pseudopilin PulG